MLNNPWLQISAGYYEGHMSAENVGQQFALNEIFKETLFEYKPQSLCVLGATTGNGFEHIDPRFTKNIVAVDINATTLEFLMIDSVGYCRDSKLFIAIWVKLVWKLIHMI